MVFWTDYQYPESHSLSERELHRMLNKNASNNEHNSLPTLHDSGPGQTQAL